jgi:hypothetical protein
MRLLNTHTIKLHEFIGQSIPKYAILSHRWEEEELTFQDIEEDSAKFLALIKPEAHLKTTGDRQAIQKRGYSKIERCCHEAKKTGYEYVWIDTCCI